MRGAKLRKTDDRLIMSCDLPAKLIGVRAFPLELMDGFNDTFCQQTDTTKNRATTKDDTANPTRSITCAHERPIEL